MAVVQNTYTGNGSTVLYSLSFSYLDQADVKVSVNGTIVTNYIFATASSIQFLTAPGAGAAIRIYRETDIDQASATIFPGSAIKAQDLNDNFTQTLYAVQESNFEADSATTTANTALTTANTAISTANAATSTANTALSNSAAAVSTANTASTNASNAVTTANTASSNASAAVTTANAATVTANSAASTAATALSTANTASSNASAAVSTANTASTNASNAVTTANTALSTANTASSNASTAVTTANNAVSTANGAVSTANSAVTTANAAAAAVANAVLYTTVANVAAIPATPSNNTAIEVTNSTGIESFSPLSGRPAGFVGSSGLSVRIIYQTAGSTWTWIQYFPNDPETRYLKLGGGIVSGNLEIGNTGSLTFEGSTADAFETTLTVVDPTADRTITLPNVNGTVVTTGDSGTVTSTMIADGTIVDADVNASAAIAGTKISPNFGSQNVVTTGTVSSASLIPTSSSVPTNGVYLPSANNVAISTGGSGRLFVDSSGNVGLGGAPKGWGGGAIGALFNGSGSITAFSDEVSYGNNVYFNGAWRYARNDTAQLLQLGSGDIPLIFYSAATGTADASISWSERFRVDASGRFGIGTSSPGNILHVTPANSSGASATDGVRVSAGTSSVGINFGANSSGTFGWIQSSNAGVAFAPTVINPQGGNVGIGTTSPAARLDIRGSGPYMYIVDSGANSAAFVAEATNSVVNVGSTYLGTSAVPLAFVTGGTERARIDTSGRLLVGTSSGSGNNLLQVQGEVGSSAGIGGIVLRRGLAPSLLSSGSIMGRIDFGPNDGGIGASIVGEGDAQQGTNDYPSRLVFSTTADGASSPTERMRIENSGLLRFSNDTTADKRRAVFATGPNDANFQLGFTNGTGGGANTEQGRLDFVYDGAGSLGRIGFWRGAGAQCARITVIAGANGVYLSENATTWTSASDERLKTDLVPIGNALDKIGAARAFTGRYHTDEAGVSRAFLIAQDFQSILPEAVNESNPDELGLNYSDVIPLLVAALKESKERIETLEAKVAALETA